ncbi:MAG: hypothetical protein S4CHLAM37_03090 [Chlamydiia bacterium]|nr:hypothetical protein [Chlamydiia bacterium]
MMFRCFLFLILSAHFLAFGVQDKILVFVTNGANGGAVKNTVAKATFNTSTKTFSSTVTTISGFSSPKGLVVAPNNATVFVVNSQSSNVSLIALPGNTVTNAKIVTESKEQVTLTNAALVTIVPGGTAFTLTDFPNGTAQNLLCSARPITFPILGLSFILARTSTPTGTINQEKILRTPKKTTDLTYTFSLLTENNGIQVKDESGHVVATLTDASKFSDTQSLAITQELGTTANIIQQYRAYTNTSSNKGARKPN